MCAVYWAGVTLWTHRHCSSASPHACHVCACVQFTGQVSASGPINTAAVPAPMSDLSVRVFRLLGRCHPSNSSTLQRCQQKRKRIAAIAPMPDLSVRVCRLLGRCHPLDPSTLQPEAVPENMTDQVCNSVQSSGTYICGDGYVCLNGDYEAFYVSTSCQA